MIQELASLRMEFQELQQVHEEQEDVLCWKERELIAIKGALQEEISAHAKEVEALKEQHKEEVQKLLKAKEEVKQASGNNLDHLVYTQMVITSNWDRIVHFHLFIVMLICPKQLKIRKQISWYFFSLQLSSLREPVPMLGLDSCFWLRGVKPRVVVCCCSSSTARF